MYVISFRVSTSDSYHRHDGLPVWVRPLARAPHGMGKEMSVSRMPLYIHSLCLALIRYMVRTENSTASKNVDHISFVSDLPAHTRMTHIPPRHEEGRRRCRPACERIQRTLSRQSELESMMDKQMYYRSQIYEVASLDHLKFNFDSMVERRQIVGLILTC